MKNGVLYIAGEDYGGDGGYGCEDEDKIVKERAMMLVMNIQSER